MGNQLEASIVRIFDGDGGVIGTGFLVTEEIILTCAHVITSALKINESSSTVPTEAVCLDFPLVAARQFFSAHVVKWALPQPTSGDIALLHLNDQKPEAAQAVRLLCADDLWGHNFRAFGFPAYHDEGVWASGKLLTHEASGWIQMEDVKETGHRVQPGFSGGAVWDEQLSGVVGMIVAADDPTTKVAYMIPAKLLLAFCPELAQQSIPRSPYRGLFAFREQDAAFFFGRQSFTDELLRAMQEQSTAIIIGPSGSGKSSVLFAGLLSSLSHMPTWRCTHFRPGNRPFHALASALIPLLEPDLSETDRLLEITKLAQSLQQRNLLLQDVLERIQQKQQASLLVAVDQFEELYTLCADTTMQQQFLDVLLAAFGHQQHKLDHHAGMALTLRADFLGQALLHRAFAETCQRSLFILPPMTRTQLKEVIEKPAQQMGVALASGLTERMVNDVENEPGELPLLEFALTLLWEQQEQQQLTHQVYEKIGGVKGALIQYADQVYAAFPEQEQALVRRVLVQLVRPGQATADTRRVATRAELGEEGWAMARRLSDLRLVVTTTTSDQQQAAELVHEALIQTWEPLRTWMNADRIFRDWQERFRIALRQWTENDKDESTLLRGTLLEEALRWLKLRDQAFSPGEKSYLCHCVLYRAEISSIKKWQRQYGTVKDIITFLDKYWGSFSSEQIMGCIEALRSLPGHDDDDEICDQLRQFVYSDIELRLSVFAIIGICERGHYADLAQLLEPGALNAQAQVLFLSALATAHNIPGISVKLAYAQPTLVKTIATRTQIYVLISYIKLLFITTCTTSLLGLFTLLATSFSYNFIAPQISFLSNIKAPTLYVELLNIVATLVSGAIIFLYVHMIKRKDLTLKTCFLAAIPAISLEAIEVAVSSGSSFGLLAWPFFVLFLASLLSILLRMAVTALFLWLPFKNQRRKIAKLVWAAVLYAGLEVLFQNSILPQLTLLLTEIAQLSPAKLLSHISSIILNHIQSSGTLLTPSLLVSWLLLSLVAAGCMLGFWLGWLLAEQFERNSKIVSLLTYLLPLKLDTQTIVLQTPLLSTRRIRLKDRTYLSPTLESLQATRPKPRLNDARTTKLLMQYTILVALLTIGLLALNSGFSWFVEQAHSHYPYTYYGHSASVDSVVWSPDGTYIASEDDSHTLQIWNALTGHTLFTYQGRSNAVVDFAWSPDGSRIALVDNDSTVQIWNVATAHILFTYHDHSTSVEAFAWSPDGSRIASADADQKIRIWNAATGQQTQEFVYQGQAHNLTWSPDGTRIASTSTQNSQATSASDTVQIWNAATGKAYPAYNAVKDSANSEAINSIIWSPDSKSLAITASYNLKAWLRIKDVASGSTLSYSKENVDEITFAALWSHDGTKLVWGGSNQLNSLGSDTGIWMQVQDAQTGKVLSSTSSPIAYSQRSNNFSLPSLFSWSPDMTQVALVLGSQVRVWDTTTMNSVYIYSGHSGQVNAIAWSPDGRHIASSDAYHATVQIWDAI